MKWDFGIIRCSNVDYDLILHANRIPKTWDQKPWKIQFQKNGKYSKLVDGIKRWLEVKHTEKYKKSQMTALVTTLLLKVGRSQKFFLMMNWALSKCPIRGWKISWVWIPYALNSTDFIYSLIGHFDDGWLVVKIVFGIYLPLYIQPWYVKDVEK